MLRQTDPEALITASHTPFAYFFAQHLDSQLHGDLLAPPDEYQGATRLAAPDSICIPNREAGASAGRAFEMPMEARSYYGGTEIGVLLNSITDKARQEERARISRDLHNTVVQDLGITTHLLARVREQMYLALGMLEDSQLAIAGSIVLGQAPREDPMLEAASGEVLRKLRECGAIMGSLLGEDISCSSLQKRPPQEKQAGAATLLFHPKESLPIDGNPMMEDLMSLVRGTRHRLRDVCTDLRPTNMYASLLCALSRSLQELGRIAPDGEIEMTVQGEEPNTLSSSDLYLCSKVADQAVYNALSHAGASHISVRAVFAEYVTCAGIGADRFGVALRIADNGREFEPRTPGYWRSTNHHGLANMYDSAYQLGCDLTIRSGPEQGTEVCLLVPHRASACERPRQ